MNTTTKITRKTAAQDRRTICRNFRDAAHRSGVRPIALMKAAGVKPLRMLRAWLGQQIFVPDMFRLARELDMSVDDMFAGTRAKETR
ncbi:hypothetical protein ITJ58_16485 [Curtobacterium flaccumfaciens]|uniref:hypothetical protein n=1 Tax=Curtobacterium flaccumfaciens TaxID=2035 RepID=UPI00188B57E2|nr:hypothetical protein [Curtobacterium flaccumfaciens]MBF4595362.1 hypothetical protein [Curtobacterium flaccumfaciens]